MNERRNGSLKIGSRMTQGGEIHELQKHLKVQRLLEEIVLEF